ncbi:hypothetical protein [Thalassotalea sp. PLHSN55]|uniref:hypothetical protein n=1 Tax=Thalassotalea sp. PLHSN55 TaxID=3435888 RepID=UPI003F844ED2
MSINKTVQLVLCFTLFFCVTACSDEQTQVVKAGWTKSCPNNEFCFIHPESLKSAEIQIIDSTAGKLEDDNMVVLFDLSIYASQLDDLRQAKTESVTIDDLSGTLFVQDKRIGLAIPEVNGTVRFSMLIIYKEALAEEQGKEILKSITFKQPK